MPRRCFYSFHYKPDNWRASQVRNIGVVEGNRPATDNDWETITKGGDEKIKKWIKSQMRGRSCTVILAGANTANRKWINYEIIESWNAGMGVVVIYIHKLNNSAGMQTTKGLNPLSFISIGADKKILATIAKAYDPQHVTSKGVYTYISDNLEDWVEEAIQIRKAY